MIMFSFVLDLSNYLIQIHLIILAVEKEISPYGDSVNPSRAPETITNAVASLPPEQMFELMKQMKVTF